MPIFAAKPDEFLLPFLFIALIGGTIGLLVGSLINALWLRAAGAWVRVAQFDFGKAFKATLLTNFILMAFGLSLAFSIMYLLRLEGPDSMSFPRNLSFWFSPITFFYFALGSVLIHATVFGHVFVDADGAPLRFSKASLLALVYIALCSMFSFVVGLAMLAVLTVTVTR